MRKMLLGLGLFLSLEGVALACSCIVPGSPQASREAARNAVQHAVAIVEVDVLSAYRPGGPGETVRVRRVLFGKAPGKFRIQRGDFANSASCDLLLTKGERKVLLLYRPRGRQARGQQFQIQDLCTDYLTGQAYFPVVLKAARLRRS